VYSVQPNQKRSVPIGSPVACLPARCPLTNLFRRPFSAYAGARTRALHASGRAAHELQIRNHRFDVALNNLTQGVCFFDGKQRMILANQRYAEISNLSAESVHPGITLTQIVDMRFASGAFPVARLDRDF